MEVPPLSSLWIEQPRPNYSLVLGARRETVSGSQKLLIQFLLSAIVFTVFQLVFQTLHIRSPRRPPRLPLWEFMFQIHVLRRKPAAGLHNLVKRYGPVMHVNLWYQDVLVLSSVAVVEEFYKLHDMEFGGRPSSMERMTLSDSIGAFCFPPIAAYWKHLRFVLECDALLLLYYDCHIPAQSFVCPFMNDDCLCLSYSVHHIDPFTFKDMTISEPFERGSTCGIQWALEALHDHPEVIEYIREELDSSLDANHKVEESDISKLPYLQAVVKELFRLHPPSEFSFPHESTDDYCRFSGFELAPRTQVLINIHSVQRDPLMWVNPDEFDPVRFVSQPDVDMRGQHYQLVPFGAGPRQCPGMKLAIQYVQLGLARHCQNTNT